MKPKTILKCAACCLFALTGCQQKPDPKIALLEARIALLDQRQADIESRQLLTDARAFTNVNNFITQFDLVNTRCDLMMDEVAILNSSLTNMLALATNAPPKTLVKYYPLPAPAPSFKDGIPASVYAQIQSDAERQHPGDFKMQEFVIKLQVASYKKLHP